MFSIYFSRTNAWIMLNLGVPLGLYLTSISACLSLSQSLMTLSCFVAHPSAFWHWGRFDDVTGQGRMPTISGVGVCLFLVVSLGAGFYLSIDVVVGFVVGFRHVCYHAFTVPFSYQTNQVGLHISLCTAWAFTLGWASLLCQVLFIVP